MTANSTCPLNKVWWSNVQYKSITVFGNGKSRKNIRAVGEEPNMRIGCNAAYRDLNCDIYVSVDCHISAEMASKANETSLYLVRDWIKMPIEVKDSIIESYKMSDPDSIVADYTDPNNPPKEIVVSGLTNVINKSLVLNNARRKEFNEIVIADADKLNVHDLKEVGCDLQEEVTLEFAGSNALHLAAMLGKDRAIPVYLCGFDFQTSNIVNNIYAGTENYLMAGAKENLKMQQSVYELAYIIKRFPTVHFNWIRPENKTVLSNIDPLLKLENFHEKLIDDVPHVYVYD